MYKFIDTTGLQSSAALPSEALNINGVYIEEKIEGYRTLSVEGRELLESEIDDCQIGFQNGTVYQQKRDAKRVITVNYELLSDSPESFREKFNCLSQILDQEQARLVFRDEADKYFIGTKSSIGDVMPGTMNTVSSFRFQCSDPYKYAVTPRVARNNGGDAITLSNDGSKPSPIYVKAAMRSDNGYLGLTLEDRFYQIGNPGEVDGVDKERTELLFDDHFTKDAGWLLNQGVTPWVTGERLQDGRIAYRVEDPVADEGFVYVTDYGSGNSWHGAALTKEVPPDSQGGYPVNWRSEWRFDMNTDPGGPNAGKQVGHNSVTFSDENDRVICSVVFEDNNPVNERSDMAVYIDGKRIWDTRETQKFYVTGRGGNGPVVIVEKLGNQITVGFSYGGVRKTFLTDVPDAQLRKVTWYCAAYKAYPAINNNNIRAINLRKHNVQYYEDIPNFFRAGDRVELLGDSNELFINDIKDWDRVDIGSRPLLLPSGRHTLGIAVSEWAELPEVEVTYRERWL